MSQSKSFSAVLFDLDGTLTDPRNENAVYDGVAEMLTVLKAAGKRLFVATAKPQVFAVAILEQSGLARYFASICGCEMDRADIPKGIIIRMILQDYGITAASAVMIGDRPPDILGARENAVYAVGVTYGEGSAAELREAGADVLCASPEQVTRILSS